jgi:competence ComEA-like helix-hairpin-helix protein
VDINSASIDQLIELNGIGKAKANKIINYRKTNQCFTSIDELIQIDGISSNLVSKNSHLITIGQCDKDKQIDKIKNSMFKDVILDPVNIIFVVFILSLAFLDIKTKKDLKSQIVSVGVLGTFVGIFIGLQGFDPKDIVNSVNDILVGLKTAFFTSIVGMSVATILSIKEKIS